MLELRITELKFDEICTVVSEVLQFACNAVLKLNLASTAEAKQKTRLIRYKVLCTKHNVGNFK